MVIDTAHKFPISAVADNQILINRNGDLTLVYRATFQDLNSYSIPDLETLHKNFRMGFGNLLEGTMVHFQTHVVSETYKKTGDNEHLADTFLGESNERMLYEKNFRTTQSYIYFTLCSKSPFKRRISSSTLFSFGSKFKKIDEKVFNKFKLGVTSFLHAISQDFNFEFELVTDNKSELSGNDAKLSISEQFMYLTNKDTSIKEVVFNEDHFQIGQKKGTILMLNSIDTIPDLLPLYVINKNLSSAASRFPATLCKQIVHAASADMVWNVMFYKENVNDIRSEIEQEIKFKKSLSGLSMENDLSEKESKQFIDGMINSPDHPMPITVHCNSVIYTEEDNLEELISEIELGYKNTGFLPTRAGAEMANIFYSSIPGNAANLDKDNVVLTFDYVLPALINWEEITKGSNNTLNGYSVVNRKGARVTVDFFAESGVGAIRQDITGYSGYIIGPTGSGKSVFLNYLIRQIWEKGSYVIVVDNGHSYRMLSQHLEGEYIEFSENKPLTFNPFIIKSDNPTVRETLNILSILSVIWQGDREIEGLESSIITSSIRLYYTWLKEFNINQKERGLKLLRACFDTYYYYLREHFRKVELPQINTSKTFNIDHYLDSLNPFYAKGQYGEVLNKDTAFKITNNRLIVFELSEISKNPILSKIVMMYIMNIYEELLAEKPGIRKFLMIEESWKAIMNKKFSVFIKEVYKTARKYFGSIFMITQEPEDLLSSSEVGQTIVSQSDIKFILNMSKYVNLRDEIKTKLGFNDADMDLLYSLNGELPENIRMREVFVKWNQLKSVYGIMLSEEEYWVYTTEQKEKNVVIYLYRNVYSRNLKNTIKYLAELHRKFGNSKAVVDYIYNQYDIETKAKLNLELLTI